MNGPEHYAEAERLIAAAREVAKPIATMQESAVRNEPAEAMRVIDASIRMVGSILAEAQVHATLAVADALTNYLPGRIA